MTRRERIRILQREIDATVYAVTVLGRKLDAARAVMEDEITLEDGEFSEIATVTIRASQVALHCLTIPIG